ncbi:MAG: tail fiber domain-containing protein, partial [Gammaproteobacteria bacterium]|nr:tail fiber domain-containing protein [Gammaproteobacteria bacterium]
VVEEPQQAPVPAAEPVSEVAEAPQQAPVPAPEPVIEVAEAPAAEPAPEAIVTAEPVPAAVVAPRQGPAGPPGPPGPAGAATIKGTPGFLVRFKDVTEGTDSQIFDDGNQVGIGTTEPKQRLEVNGSIQIHEKNSSVAGLMITQSSGETGYIMHNRASTLTIGAGSMDRMTIDRNGNVGIGVARPTHALELASGAHATAGGVWTNSSSRERKENISALSVEDAVATLAKLQPVHFNYRSDASESYVGFIAEDVPELVATSDRQGLSAMDIVAVLTKVIQAQQRRIDDLESRLEK